MNCERYENELYDLAELFKIFGIYNLRFEPFKIVSVSLMHVETV